MEYGMQFTHWLKTRDECESWFLWFRDREIPAAIVGHNGSFAVFRRGAVERRMEHGGTRLVEVKTKIDGPAIVVVACNGYLDGGNCGKNGEK